MLCDWTTLILVGLILGMVFNVAFGPYKPENDPHILTQTGFRQLDITHLKMSCFEKAAAHPQALSDMIETPRTILRSISPTLSPTDLATALLTPNAAFIKSSDNDNNVPLFRYMSNLAAQAMAILYCIAGNKEMTEAKIHDDLEIKRFMDLMRNTIQNRDIDLLLFKNDGGVPVNMTELIQTLTWNGSVTLTGENHNNWVNRWLYVLALGWKDQFPMLNEKFETATDAQIWKTVLLFLIRGILTLYQFFPIAFMQSDRANFSMGYLQEKLITKVSAKEYATSLDERWAKFVRTNKASFLVPSSYTALTKNWLNVEAINGQTLEDSIARFSTRYKVIDMSLKMARTSFGIGKVDAHGNQVDFAVFLDPMFGINTTTGTVQRYGYGASPVDENEWPLGYPTTVAIQIFDDMEFLPDLWDQCLQRRKHWTYSDVAAWAKTMFVDFDMKSSLNGSIEADAYKGIRGNVGFTVYADPLIASKFSSPNAMFTASTNELILDPFTVNDVAMADKEPQVSLWILCFIMQSKLCPWLLSIQVPNSTERERAFMIRYGLLLSRQKPIIPKYGSNDLYRIWASRQHYVEVVNAKDHEYVGLMSKDSEEIRYTNLAVPAGSYISNIEKHAVCCFKRNKAIKEAASASRLVQKDEWPIKTDIPVTHDKEGRLFLQSLLVNSSLPPSSVSIPKTEPTPPSPEVPTPQTTEEEETEES